MPVRNSAFDRYIKFVPNRILKAQELERVEQLQSDEDQYGIGTVYREGGTWNVEPSISGDIVNLGPRDPSQPMYIFVNGRYESFDPCGFTFTGVSDCKIFLNWTWLRVTYNDSGTINDSTLIDTATGEKVAEVAQLAFTLGTVDLSVDTTGVAVDSTTQFQKNQHTILVYEFARNSSSQLILTDNYERVKGPALGYTKNAGLVRVTAQPDGLALSPFDPEYLALQVRLAALEAQPAPKDWTDTVHQILDRLDAIPVTPPEPPATAALLLISPNTLDFTNTPYTAGVSLEKKFTLKNIGGTDAPYNLVNAALGYDFTVLGGGLGIIKKNSSISFTVVFAPSKEYPSPVGGAVTINDDLSCVLTGSTVVAAPSLPSFAFNQTTLNFGSVATADFRMLQLAITNVGTATGTYQLQLEPGVFAISDDGFTPMSRTLTAGQQVTIQVVFCPSEVHNYSIPLNFAQYGANSCNLRGIGISPQDQYYFCNDRAYDYTSFSTAGGGTQGSYNSFDRGDFGGNQMQRILGSSSGGNCLVSLYAGNVSANGPGPGLYLTNTTDFEIKGYYYQHRNPSSSPDTTTNSTYWRWTTEKVWPSKFIDEDGEQFYIQSPVMVSIGATGVRAGNFSAYLCIKNGGFNQGTLLPDQYGLGYTNYVASDAAGVSVSVVEIGTALPQFVFSDPIKDWSCDLVNKTQTNTITVSNYGTTAGTPTVLIDQSHQWFTLSYTSGGKTYSSLGQSSIQLPQLATGGQTSQAGSFVQLTVTFTPSQDMTADDYPNVGGALSFLNQGTNDHIIAARVHGFAPSADVNVVDGGIVEYGADKTVSFTISDTGDTGGIVKLVVSDSWLQIVQPAGTGNSSSGTVDPSTPLTVQVKFTANDAAFTALNQTILFPNTLYEFVADVWGVSPPVEVKFQARSKDFRTTSFSMQPQGGTGVTQVQLSDASLGAPQTTTATFKVYNIGNAPGKPQFTPGTGTPSYFTITRLGTDAEIPPGASAIYQVSALANESVTVTKTANFALDVGSVQFNMDAKIQPFQTVFCDVSGTPISSYDFGLQYYLKSGDVKTAIVYLKKVTGTGFPVVSIVGMPGSIDYSVALTGTDFNATTGLIPVTLQVTLNGNGDGEAYATALGAAALKITLTSKFLTVGLPTTAPVINVITGQTIYTAYTPDGNKWTFNPALSGIYISRPVYDSGGMVVGSL